MNGRSNNTSHFKVRGARVFFFAAVSLNVPNGEMKWPFKESVTFYGVRYHGVGWEFDEVSLNVT